MRNWYRELLERNVVKVATVYLVVAWLVLQVATVMFSNFGPPPWVPRTFTVVVILGFPVACVLAWALELTPTGIRRTGSTARHGSAAAPGGAPTPDVIGISGSAAPAPDAAPRSPPAAGNAVAVLPLRNASGDPEQELFVEGVTEDLITELSRFHDLMVISRSSAFRYKGETVSARQAGAELGVHFVVEGSVRRFEKRLRLTVQLTDAETGASVWAERYERELADIFALQDELTRSIVAVIRGRVEAVRAERAVRKATANMAAYECVLAGKRLHHRSSRADNARALELLERAVALDPNYAHAHAWLGCTLGQAWAHGWMPEKAQLDTVLRATQTALALDETDADVHRILAAVYISQHQFERAWQHQQRAVALNPNDDLVVVQQGEMLTWFGRAEEGIEWVQKAMRLNPYHSERYWWHLGRACFTARRYADAVATLNHLAEPDTAQRAFAVASRARLGQSAETRAARDRLLADAPDFAVEPFLKTQHYVQPEDTAHLRAALLAAGLPG